LRAEQFNCLDFEFAEKWGDGRLARILVLDGHSAAALSVTRSAGRAGHWVAVGANQGLFAAAQLSRYCSSRFNFPASTDNASRFLDAVLEFVRSQGIDLVMPMTDWTMGPLSSHREMFVGACRLALPSAHALEIASDKYQTIRMAEAIGIAVPRTHLIESSGGLSAAEGLAFPVAIKDRFSVRWSGDKATSGSVAYAYSRAELESKVSARLRAADDVLLQEFVSGRGVGFSCFVAAGEVFVPFQWERIREVDPRGSGSSARESIPLDDQIVALGGRLLSEIGFEGIAMVEYKRTPGGKMMLMEINGRPWGSLALPVACGIDYPRYLIDWYLSGTLPPKSVPYKAGTICRRIVGELTHLSNLRAGKQDNWPLPYPSFWKSLAQMALPWRPGMYFDDLWLSDVRPGLAGIANWFRRRITPR
jgi:predicted ATP-grasp superfamily ATP-dependent carboligase